MRRSWKWWIWASLVGVLFVLFTLYAVERLEPTKEDAGRDAKNPGQKEAVDILSSERVAYYTKVLAILTGALAFSSGLQIYFLIRADENAREAANTATQALRAERRAYVMPEAVLVTDDFGENWQARRRNVVQE